MSVRAVCLWLGMCGLLHGVLACSFDAGVNDAHGCGEDCADCQLGYCLMTIEEAATAGGSGGSGGTAGSSSVGGSGGFAGSGGVGGSSGAAGVGSGGMNAIAGAGAGAGAGGGPAEPCTGQPVSAIESCNAIDDDCDGTVDEGTSVACYPAGTEGCAANADGSFACIGSCATGMQSCVAGVLSECTGFVGPTPEVCGGAEAMDENCNGSVDDSCPCEGTETQRCYDGPTLTAGVGLCRAGVQTCERGLFGPCVGAITPAPETCLNDGADDNCNRRRDDVPNRGVPCLDFSKQGACFVGVGACHVGVVVCETPAPAPTETACDQIDEDCDGNTDETFSLGSDEQNCGACGTRCASGQQCCGGMCRNVESDPANCGRCNMACGGGAACCGGACTVTNTDQRCGGCNIACSATQDCCGATCMDTNTTANCGGCNIACGPGQVCCDTGCAQLNTPAHCGGCNMPCGPTQDCCDGVCMPRGPDGSQCGVGGCNVTCPESCPCRDGECRDANGLACL